MPYFTISTGLRGCYMPDNCFSIRATTRRELKSVIESEAEIYRDAGFILSANVALCLVIVNAMGARGLAGSFMPGKVPVPACMRIFARSRSKANALLYRARNRDGIPAASLYGIRLP